MHIQDLNLIIKISKNDISTGINNIASGKIGAVVIFLGIVKKVNNKKEVAYINYSIFEKLFYSILKKYSISLLNNNKNININRSNNKPFLRGHLSPDRISSVRRQW